MVEIIQCPGQSLYLGTVVCVMKKIINRYCILLIIFVLASCSNDQKVKTETYTVPKGTTVRYGTPARPLQQSILDRLIKNFEKDSTILEVYQFGQTQNREFSLVLGFRLANYSEKSKKAAIKSVYDVIQNEDIGTLDMCFLDNDDLYDHVQKVQNSLLYIK